MTLRPTVFGVSRYVGCCPSYRWRRVASHLALAVGREANVTRCSSLVLQVEVPNGTRSFGVTHLPKNPYCPHCQRAKMENVKLRRKGGAAAHDVANFGDLATADTMVLRGLKDRGFHGEADAIVFYDLATDCLDVLPVQPRSRSNTLEAF